MSEIILSLAQGVLAKPTEKSSREAIAAALLIAHVAWNRAVDPGGGDQVGQYRKVLDALKLENPKLLDELKSRDCELLIEAVAKAKRKQFPADNRIIHRCGLTAENKVHVAWASRDGRVMN